jgi:hypothetical protein
MGVTFSIRFDPLELFFKLPYSPRKYNPARENIIRYWSEAKEGYFHEE